jgi:DNA-binding NarL/FixJ family response regulator
MSQTEPRHPPLRVLIVDDHALVRHGIQDVLSDEPEMEVLGEAGDGAAAVQLVRQLVPLGLNLVLMDIDMPGLDGIGATRQILAEHPGLPVIMLTVSTTESDLFDAIQAGAVGFLSKGLSPEALVRSLRDFQRDGALPMSRTMASRVIAHFRRQASQRLDVMWAEPAENDPPQRTHQTQPVDDLHGVQSRHDFDDTHDTRFGHQEALTPREREILALIAEGLRDREIAERLFLTENTAKTHVRNILRKLDARNRMEAVTRFRRGDL